MTDQEINIAIAEACGWHHIKIHPQGGVTGMPGPCRGWLHIPDYCHDLNAMHEAEKVFGHDLVPGSRLMTYLETLHKISAHLGDIATARQRSEAFMLTIGK